MSSDPDMNELFAPIGPSQAFEAVLTEVREVLPLVRHPVDAELWGSDMIGALSRSAPDEATMVTQLAATLVPACEKAGTPESLALLRILAAVGLPGLRDTAAQAAARLAARGVPDQPWARALGTPAVGPCWHYGDVGGHQESVTVTFSYGDDEHALSVLIDHGHGGKVKDAWVGDADGLLDRTSLAAAGDPLVIFERLTPADAHARLEEAVSAGEHPASADQRDSLNAHRALLYARMSLLAVESAIGPPPGRP